MAGTHFEDLEVWQRAKALVVQIYKATEEFPRSEMFGLTSQMRRAAVSITANVAEGSERESSGALINYLDIARGSAGELRAHIYVAEAIGYLNDEQKVHLLSELQIVSKMLGSLRNAIKRRHNLK